MAKTEHSIVVSQKPGRTIGYIAGAAFMSGLCLFMVLIDFRDADAGPFGLFTANSILYFVLKLILLGGAVFFCYGTLFFFKTARQGKAILIADEHGITDNSSALSFGLILWSDIRRIYIGSVMNQRFIELVIPDEAKYIRRLSPWKQRAILANRAMGHEIACITLNATGVSPETILPDLLCLFEQAAGNTPSPD